MSVYTSWSINESDKSYVGIFENRKRLEAGLYSLSVDGYNRPVAKNLSIRDDKMYRFTFGPMLQILEEIGSFWDERARYLSLGCTHKRGILLYGPPGCGKTAIINCLIEDMIKKDGLCIKVNYIEDFMECVPKLRQIEGERPILSIFEDIDDGYNEKELLEALDGASTLGNGIISIATTNFVDEVSDRIKFRPSRIDTLIEVGYPDAELRREYLSLITSSYEFATKTMIDYIVRNTNNYSLAALKEIVLSVVIYKNDVDDAIDRLAQTVCVDEEYDDDEEDKCQYSEVCGEP